MSVDHAKCKVISGAINDGFAHNPGEHRDKDRPRLDKDAASGVVPATGLERKSASKGNACTDWSNLMARAQDGDGAAYRCLLTGIAPYLRGLARQHLNDPSVIEDALQDVLLTIHRLRHTYNPRRPFGPWLATIAKRRFIDRYRHEARKKAREIPLEPFHETFAADQAWSHEATADRHKLRKAVGGLPPAQRDAMWLVKLNEMSLKDASLASGRSVSALKVATHRALQSLTKTFARMNE